MNSFHLVHVPPLRADVSVAIAVLSGRSFMFGARKSSSQKSCGRMLLALSCREAGCVLVSYNERDFSRIGRCLTLGTTQETPRMMGLRRGDVGLAPSIVRGLSRRSSAT